MPTLTLTLPKPHQAQAEIISQAARFNIVACGRRFGKTVLGIDRSATPESLGYPVAWFSPTYRMLQEVWREAVSIFEPITSRRSSQEKRIEFITGGLLEFWSLDNPDVARGRKYRRAIIDEAAMVSKLEDAWQQVIRPTLADYQGDAWFFSTPKGHNYFWRLFQYGLDSHMVDWRCWQMPTSANPFIATGEIEQMRLTLPERVFQQEVLAQFIDDAGGVFRGVMQAATATEQDKALNGHQYVAGVDWGKHNDFTVITILDITGGKVQQAFADRFNQIDYTVQVGRLKAIYDRFRPTVIVAEQNAMGDPIIEQLRREGMPVQSFVTTNSTKAEAIEALSLAFERREIEILNDPVTVGELQAYEMERLPSGAFRYSAPDGMHDDTVMSLAFAFHATRTSTEVMSLSDFLNKRRQ